jgi:hypothetical protein
MLLELLMGAPVVVVSPPTGFSATTINSTRIDLAWTNASGGLQIEVWRNGSLLTTLTGGTTTYQDNAISAATDYAYKLRHKSGSDYSVFTTTITRSGTPPAPTLMAADNNFEDDVAVSWTQNAASQTAVRVYREGVNVSGDLAAGATSYTDLAVPNGTYTYTVRNTNGVAEGPDSNSIDETVVYNPPLTAPSGFTATATFSDRVALAWTNGDATAQTEVYRGSSPSPTTLVATRAAGTNSYNDDELAQGTLYYYRIRHVKGAQLSAYTADDDATTPTTSFNSVDLSADAATERINLTWAYTNPPAFPTAEIGSWSDTEGEQTAAETTPVTAPHIVVTYTGREIVPVNTGTGTTGTLTYLRVKNSAGTVMATLTNLTCDFDLGAA